MDLDLLERARAGDVGAFAGVIDAFGDALLRTAVLLLGERPAAERAVGRALTRLWTELPALHSQRPSRPAMLRALLDAAADEEHAPVPDDADPLLRCLGAMPPEERTVAVLHLLDTVGAVELALVRGMNLGAAAKELRRALGTLDAGARAAGIPGGEDALTAAMRETVRGVELPPWFAEDAVLPGLAEPPGPEVRRLAGIDPADAWDALLDPGTITAWVAAEDVRVRGTMRFEPGARIVAAGRIAGARRSRDETIVTRAGDDRVLAWATASRPAPWRSAIEFRWTLAVVPADGGATELVHRLRGVAFPPGLQGRFLRAAYDRIADGMRTSMHTGIERLAQTLESRSRRPL